MADLFTTPSWESMMGSRPRTRTRTTAQTPLPGGGYSAPGTSVNTGDGPITTPGIPEDQVNRPERPPIPGAAIPVPRYEDFLSAAPEPDWGSSGVRTTYGRNASSGLGFPSFGQYGNSGESGGLNRFEELFNRFSDGGFDMENFTWAPRAGSGNRRGGGANGGSDGGDWGSGLGTGMIATGSPYTGRTGMSAADVEFWNLPADRRASYFERMAMRSVGDYDRDPGTGEIIGGPKTTAIRQLMGDLEQTAREQLQQLGGYMPRVNY